MSYTSIRPDQTCQGGGLPQIQRNPPEPQQVHAKLSQSLIYSSAPCWALKGPALRFWQQVNASPVCRLWVLLLTPDIKKKKVATCSLFDRQWNHLWKCCQEDFGFREHLRCWLHCLCHQLLRLLFGISVKRWNPIFKNKKIKTLPQLKLLLAPFWGLPASV